MVKCLWGICCSFNLIISQLSTRTQVFGINLEMNLDAVSLGVLKAFARIPPLADNFDRLQYDDTLRFIVVRLLWIRLS